MSIFCVRVKELMKEKKLSQKGLSFLSGISEPSICRYLRGDTEPRIDVVHNIAAALGVSDAYLLGSSDEYEEKDAKTEIKIMIARNRNILTKQDKSDIISILYGEEDGG